MLGILHRMSDRARSNLTDIDLLMNAEGGDRDPWLENWKALMNVSLQEAPQAKEEEVLAAVDPLLPLGSEGRWSMDGSDVGQFDLINGLLHAIVDEDKPRTAALIAGEVLKKQPWETDTMARKADLLVIQAAATEDPRKSIGLVNEALGILTGMGDEFLEQRIDAMRLLAGILQEKGEAKAAAEVMEETMRLAESTGDMPLMMTVRLDLATAYLSAKQKDKAAATIATMLPVEKLGLEPEAEMSLYFDLVTYYMGSGDVAAAVKLLEDKVNSLTKSDAKSPLLPEFIEKQAVLDAARDNLKGFLKKIARAQELRAALYGKGSGEYREAALKAVGLMLGCELLAQARSALVTIVRNDEEENVVDEAAVEALEMFIEVSEKVGAKNDIIAARERLLVYRAQLGEDDLESTLADESALAMDYAQAGQGDKAKELLARVSERISQVDLAVRGEVLLSVAEAYHMMKMWAEMEKAAVEAEDCLRRSDADVDHIVDAMTGVAYARRYQGHTDEAREIIAKTLEMLKEAHGEDSDEYQDQLECQEEFQPPSAKTMGRRQVKK
jgi:tetratricopeptide (TPR) repeat protein